MVFLTVATVVVAPATLSAKELPADSRVLTGRLENGVTWMYRRHDNPPGKMTLMMRVDSGSLNETEKQRGPAHFIEHMCFNGTENFPLGELIPYFESIGMEFGPDLNAFTSFDQTAYMLFTPNTETEQIDKALTVLSDYAFRALLLEEEIDKERGVVLEEARAGKSANQRVRDELWPELFEGTRIAKRLPIGLEKVIANAPREAIADYYRTWYRPENVTVVLVGDTDQEGIVPLIEKRFGQYQAPVPAREREGPEFKAFTEQRGLVVTDPELARCRIQMYNVRPGRPPTTTEQLWRTELVESVAGWIMDRRFDDLVNKGEASFRTANAGVGNFFNDALLTTGMAMGEPDEWSDMLEQLVIEIKRAREHGFTQRELELAKKKLLASAKRAVRTEPTRNARGFAFEIISAVNAEEPILSAQQELNLHEKVLPTVTLDEVDAVMKKHFAPGAFAYVVTTPDKPGVPVPEREEVLATAQSA
jgi:zinc protease